MFASGRDDELESHLRRVEAIRNMVTKPAPAAVAAPLARRFGDVEVDMGARTVRVKDKAVSLGPMEFRLLEYLIRNAGVAVSRNQIMSGVYGYDADIGTERVDLLIKRLRAKIHDHAEGGLISAVPGYGYRLETNVSSS
jgi:DNA-binding response OmpR family regulator